ncbi:hypothetical protein Tco_1364429 [Tanacetum coccineum]
MNYFLLDLPLREADSHGWSSSAALEDPEEELAREEEFEGVVGNIVKNLRKLLITCLIPVSILQDYPGDRRQVAGENVAGEERNPKSAQAYKQLKKDIKRYSAMMDSMTTVGD